MFSGRAAPSRAVTETWGMEMSKLLSRTIAASFLLIVAGSATAASAADRGFCHDYASAAMRQVHGALNNRRCSFRVDNETRWSTDYRAHFDWCRGVSRDQADGERDARRRVLDHCRG